VRDFDPSNRANPNVDYLDRPEVISSMFYIVTKSIINIQHIKSKSYSLERMMERDLFQDMALITANKYREAYAMNKQKNYTPFWRLLWIILIFTLAQTGKPAQT
jgi:hypothetical protein